MREREREREGSNFFCLGVRASYEDVFAEEREREYDLSTLEDAAAAAVSDSKV